MTKWERRTHKVVRDTPRFIFRVLKSVLGLVSKKYAQISSLGQAVATPIIDSLMALRASAVQVWNLLLMNSHSQPTGDCFAGTTVQAWFVSGEKELESV